MTDAISPVVDRLVAIIEGIDGIGKVWPYNPRDRQDISPHVVTEIDGIKVNRAWWVQGPVLDRQSEWLTRMSPQFVRRRWTYQIHGIEGLSPGPDGDTRLPGQDLQTLRDNALAVCDAIDADYDLAGTVFDSEPCNWLPPGPHHRMFGPAGSGFGAAYVVIEKRTVSMPNRTV